MGSGGSSIPDSTWIWHDGELIPWWDAKIHILTVAVQFGSSVFEGIRCYETPHGPSIFRLRDHIRRLYDSCRVYRMLPTHTQEEVIDACRMIVERNELEACYIRPMVLRGYGAPGLAGVGSPIETYIACWPWGTYLGEGALENGVDVCISRWQRPEPNTFPATVKSAGHYNNSQLIKWEAMADGYAEAIALGPGGMVSEGSGQNVFLVRDEVLFTPPIDGTILAGITRDSVIVLAEDAGLQVREQAIPREALYGADEIFFTGTAAEITPVRSVDRIAIGAGKAGPVTRLLQQRFLDSVHGRVPDTRGWLTPIGAAKAVPPVALMP